MTTTPTTTGLTIDRDIEGRAPVYCRYEGQIQPQPAYLELSEDGAVCASYSSELGGTPMRVAHGRDLRWTIPAETSATQLRDMLADDSEVVQLLARVHAGHSVDWDGSNMRGSLTADAESASDELERICAALADDPTDLAQVWRAGDWLFSACSLDDHWPAGRTLDSVVEELEAQAAADGLVIEGSIRDELLSHAAHIAQRNALNDETNLGTEHLDALTAAGMIDADDLETLRALIAAR